MQTPTIIAFLSVFAVGVVTGLGLMIYHLVHAPVGEQGPDGFKAIAVSGDREAAAPHSTMTRPTSA